MAYADTTRNKPDPTTIAAVIGLHAAIGFALISSLDVDFEAIIDKPLASRIFPTTPPPPPPPPEPRPTQAKAEPATAQTTIPDPYQPPVRDTLATDTTSITTGNVPAVPGTIIELPSTGGSSTVIIPRSTPTASPRPSFTPVPARPANNAAGWITDTDYRTSWINRDMTGTAQFRLDIAANGRVEDCTITRSTGHRALDEATCRLIGKRARFTPARDRNGQMVAGSYSGAIKWQVPD